VNAETSGGLEYRWIDKSNPTYEYLAVSAIAVPDQVTRDLLPATRFGQLIGDPFGRWTRGDPKPQDLPAAIAHDQQPIEQSERDCRDDEKVHRNSAIRMVDRTDKYNRSLGLRDDLPSHGHVVPIDSPR
jgi:hypothetical protein